MRRIMNPLQRLHVTFALPTPVVEGGFVYPSRCLAIGHRASTGVLQTLTVHHLFVIRLSYFESPKMLDTADLEIIYKCTTKDCEGISNVSVGCDFEWSILSFPDPFARRLKILRTSTDSINATMVNSRIFIFLPNYTMEVQVDFLNFPPSVLQKGKHRSILCGMRIHFLLLKAKSWLRSGE